MSVRFETVSYYSVSMKHKASEKATECRNLTKDPIGCPQYQVPYSKAYKNLESLCSIGPGGLDQLG